VSNPQGALERFNITGENPCECAHDTCITGWLQNPRDPKSEASFKVMLLSNFLKVKKN
jgi:hypothetical protein